MHEMAIAQSVLDIAVGEMNRHASRRIKKVKLSVGEFSGVVKDALEFAFEALKADTPASGAAFEIETVPMKIQCPECGPAECSLSDVNLICRRCGSSMQILSGRELKVDYLDLE